MTTTALSMGLFDFFESRGKDFIRLDKSQDSFGPGPLLLLYNIPPGIQDEEIQYMIQDGAPMACKKCKGGIVPFQRINPQQVLTTGDKDEIQKGMKTYYDWTVEQVLQDALMKWENEENKNNHQRETISVVDESTSSSWCYSNDQCPILYFSGFSNHEMMKTYNILANEIFQETQGSAKAACAKVVKPAMEKNFCQLLSEISSDHSQAMT